MLVKARFVEELQIDEIDFRFVFLLSVDDARLLGQPVLARPGAGGIVTFGGDEQIPDEDQTRLFVATMNFKPDGGEAPTATDTIVTLRPGGFYWIMLGGLLPRGIDERNTEVVQPDQGQLRGFRMARLEAQGIYLAPAATEFIGLVHLIGGALPEEPMQPALTAQALVTPEGEGGVAEALRHAPAQLFDDDPGERGAVPAGEAPARPPDMEGAQGPVVPVVSQEMVDQFFRITGCVLGFPLTRAFLEDGLRRYSALNGQRGRPALFELYRLWAQATKDRVERDYVDPDAPADLHTLIGEPLRQTVVDLSNPTEFGAPGAKLLLHAMLAPYSLVGPASSPGGVTLREGSGVVRLLPFWACDILAQTLYPVEPEAGLEPHATRRAQAVVTEAFYHLERRNRRAFDVLRDSGFPDRDSQPLRFDFMDLPSVSGSTVFSETVVDDGVVRRKNDLEKAVMPRLSNRFVWIADERYKTPWMALAGFLGVPLRHFGRLGGRESRSAVIAEVTAPAWHPEQVERAEPVRHNFLQLATRAEVDREMARLTIDQAARANEAAELNVRPPIVEGRGRVAEHRSVLSPSQAEAFRNAQRWRLTVVTGDPGTGKAQPLDAKILTPTGWRLMGDINVGDFVIGGDGKPVEVLGVYPQGEQDIYRVTFSDGSSTECTDDHLWLTAQRNRRKKKLLPAQRINGKLLPQRETSVPFFEVRTLREIRETLVDSQGASNHQIPMVVPPQLDTINPYRPLDPYLLGLLLGNGCFRSNPPSLTLTDDELIEAVERTLPQGHSFALRSAHTAIDYRIKGTNRVNHISHEIAHLQLDGKLSIEKFIPPQYLFASVADRLALLQGLLDTDGHADRYQIEYSSSSLRLVKDVQFLVQSLGGTATLMVKEEPKYTYQGEVRTGREAYRLYVTLPPDVEPFRLTRKAERYTPRTKHPPRRIIRAVEPVGRKPAQCIRVANPDGLYVTDDFIVTHNTFVVRELARLVREATDSEGFLLVLAPTNRAAAQLAQRLQTEATVRLYLLGEESDEPGMPTEFDIAVGTVDSFRARMQTVENFRILMLGRPLVVAIDEASMLTMDQFAAVVDLMSVSPDEAWLGQEGLTDTVLRIVLIGDPFQLPSVDPGNFLWDMMRFLPVVRLREQHRFAREAGQTGGLESFFTLIRLGMERPDARQVAVDWMLAHDREHRGNPERYAPWGLDAPDNRHGQIRVVLIDDLPQRLPGDDAGWQEFMLQLNDQVRDAVFREISDWNSDGARAESVPFVPHPASPAEREAAWRRQVLFRTDMTSPKAPFKVVTMFRRLVSESGLTHYISSAQRVNGWFHDALQGMLIGPDAQRQVAMTDLPASMVIPDLTWRDRWRELAHGNRLAEARHYAFSSRPRDLVLCPGWPYTVLRNEFRPFGIFRSETVTYTGPVQERGRQRFRFISEQGREMVISRRYARLRYLAYGWSTNVHQIQGAEYPLVVALWFEGMAYRQAQAWWQAIQPDAARGTERLELGGDGEERMDLRAFYTAITRTRARFDLVRREKQTNLKVVTPSPGRCVIIAGRHALRRYLGLQVLQRATGFAGTVLDLVRAGAQEAQL